MVTRTSWVGWIGLLALGAACAPPSGGSVPPPPTDRAQQAAPGPLAAPSPCLALPLPAGRSPAPQPPTLPPVALPADVRVVSVQLCIQRAEDVPGKGVWIVRRVTVARTGLRPLVRALRSPDAPASRLPCTLQAIVLQPFTVTLADGRVLQPRVPVGPCGRPLRSVRAALSAVTAAGTMVTSTRVLQIRSELSVRSNCPDRIKDLADLPGRPTPVTVATAQPPMSAIAARVPKTGTVQLCGYTRLAGDTFPELQLVQVVRVAAEPLHRAIAAASPTGCSGPVQRLALVGTAGNPQPVLTVEIGGCRRILDADWRALGALPATTVLLLH